jgi:hypothetical protein
MERAEVDIPDNVDKRFCQHIRYDGSHTRRRGWIQERTSVNRMMKAGATPGEKNACPDEDRIIARLNQKERSLTCRKQRMESAKQRSLVLTTARTLAHAQCLPEAG